MREITKKVFFLFVLLFFLPGWIFSRSLLEKLKGDCPQWMMDQIEKDLAPFKGLKISKNEMAEFFNLVSKTNNVCKCEIRSNQVTLVFHFQKTFDREYRLNAYLKALQDIADSIDLPDTTFFLCIYDGVYLRWPDNWPDEWSHNNWSKMWCDGNEPFPLFVFSAHEIKGVPPIIYIPDFEALSEKYQTVQGRDISYFSIPWSKKKSRLIWRGATGQTGWHSFEKIEIPYVYLTNKNFIHFTRFALCLNSLEYPDLIDSKFTITDRDDLAAEFKELFGQHVPYLSQMMYKYHIMINGNGASFSNSGWKFFTNSVVFLPEDNWKQWYYSALKPYVHYIPISQDLDDLVEKILWAKSHDSDCQEIARNAMDFARNNLTRNDHLSYLYHLLVEYSKLEIFY